MNLLIFMAGMIAGMIVGIVIGYSIFLWTRRAIEEDDKFYQRLEQDRMR